MKGQFPRHPQPSKLITRIETTSTTKARQEMHVLREKGDPSWPQNPSQRRFLWLRVLLVCGPAVSFLYALYGIAPVYRAEATLLIEPQAERTANGYEQVVPSSRELGDNEEKTQHELLKNRNLASLVIQEQRLDPQPSSVLLQETKVATFASNSQADKATVVRAEAIEAYLRNLEILPVQATRLVRVGVRDTDPQRAARIANAHVEAFIRQSQLQPHQLRAPRFTLVDKAIPASRPIQSQATTGLLLGLGAWILASGGLLYWSTRSSSRVQTPADVTDKLDLATLGVIPDFSTKEVRAEGAQPLPSQLATFPGVFPKELLLAYHPLSLVPEAYRNLRAELLLSCPSAPPRLLLMTSGISGEGKTLTVLNTAISLAQMGARVLIIDADLRHPHCHSVLKMPKGLGLSEFLTGQRELAEVIQTTRVERLFFLSGGALPPNPAELLGSKRMRAALSFLSHLYDYIVIDSPPLGLVRDALLLSPLVDGVVLVVNSQMNHLKIVQEARARLTHVHAKVLGVVLNKMDAQSRDYVDYCRRYRAYYRQASGGVREETHLVSPSGRPGVQPAAKTIPSKKVRKNPRKVEPKVNAPLLEVQTTRDEKKEKVQAQPQAQEVNVSPPTEAVLVTEAVDARATRQAPPVTADESVAPTARSGGAIETSFETIASAPCTEDIDLALQGPDPLATGEDPAVGAPVDVAPLDPHVSSSEDSHTEESNAISSS